MCHARKALGRRISPGQASLLLRTSRERDSLSINLLRLIARFDLNPKGAAVFNYNTLRQTSAANSPFQAIARRRQITD